MSVLKNIKNIVCFVFALIIPGLCCFSPEFADLIFEKIIFRYMPNILGFIFFIFVFVIVPSFFSKIEKTKKIAGNILQFMSWLLGLFFVIGSAYVAWIVFGPFVAMISTVFVLFEIPIVFCAIWTEDGTIYFYKIVLPLLLSCFFRFCVIVLLEDTKENMGTLFLKSFDILWWIEFPVRFVEFIISTRPFNIFKKATIAVLTISFYLLISVLVTMLFDFQETRSTINYYQNKKHSESQSDVSNSADYWFTQSSRTRHNSSCKWYMKSKGFPCTKEIGKPCKKCGG